MEEQVETYPGLAPAVFDKSKPPKLLSSMELESCCRSAKWCTDGGAILTTGEDRSLNIWTCSSEQANSQIVEDFTPSLTRVKNFRQGSPIYDTAWYPFATPTQPAGYCFLASIRDAPVRLLDAGDGRIRASYRIVDHRERFAAPHSLAFSLGSQKFYCGFLDAIEVFDLNSPGEGTRLLTIPTKRSKDGLRGIISSLSFCPDFSGLYAAGTFNSSIGMFSEDTGADVLMYLDGVSGPVSHLQFHPTNPRLLFAACRSQKDVLVWDVRNTTHLYSSLQLDSSSNQRRRFDIDSAGNNLVAGDEKGNVRIYDVGTMQAELPALSFKGHDDAISNATFHPTQASLLTVSGSYKFQSVNSVAVGATRSEGGATSSSEDSEDSGDIDGVVKIARTRMGTSDSSMKLWQSRPL